MTYRLTKIEPRVDAENRIVAIAFDVELLTNDVVTVVRPTVEFYPEPLAMLDTFTPEQLSALCDVIVSNKGLDQPKAPLVVTPPPIVTPPTDADQRNIWMSSIDNTVASITSVFTRFAREYGKRLAAAQVYKAAGYTGDPTTWITRFADNTGITYQVCADLIISQAADYDAAEEMLSDLRMDKYKVLNAPTIEEARVIYDSIISQCNVIAGSLS